MSHLVRANRGDKLRETFQAVVHLGQADLAAKHLGVSPRLLQRSQVRLCLTQRLDAHLRARQILALDTIQLVNMFAQTADLLIRLACRGMIGLAGVKRQQQRANLRRTRYAPLQVAHTCAFLGPLALHLRLSNN